MQTSAWRSPWRWRAGRARVAHIGRRIDYCGHRHFGPCLIAKGAITSDAALGVASNSDEVVVGQLGGGNDNASNARWLKGANRRSLRDAERQRVYEGSSQLIIGKIAPGSDSTRGSLSTRCHPDAVRSARAAGG